MRRHSSRVAIKIIIGSILILAASLFYMMSIHIFDTLADNFSYSAKINSRDNLFDPARNRFRGSQSSKTDFFYNVTKKQGDVLGVQNVFDVKTQAGEQIVRIVRNYGINRDTSQHQAGYGDRDRDGYLFAPKHMKSGQGYRYWHVNYDRPVDMSYDSSEIIAGLKLFRYKSSFDADQTKELDGLPGVPEKYGMILHVKLTTWIEPNTGRLIKYEDSAEANYYDQKSKKEAMPWNRFSNSYSQASINTQIDLARKELGQRQLFGVTLPSIILAIAALVILSAFVDPRAYIRQSHLIIGLLGLAVTIVLYHQAKNNQDYQRTIELDIKTSKLEDEIQTRISGYGDALYAGQGLFNSSQAVNMDEWKSFAETLNLQFRLPGLQGIGFSQKVESNGKQPFETASRRLLTNPQFLIYPSGERNEYHPVIYMEPSDDINKKSIGYDMFQDPARHTAMVAAADNDEAALSGKVTLAQSGSASGEKGFVLYLPVYENNLSLKTPAERQQALKGFVFTPFRSKDFINSILTKTGEDLAFKLYADGQAKNDLIYENLPEQISKYPDAIKQSTVNLQGQTWYIVYFKNDSGISPASGARQAYILVLGFIISGLASGTLLLLTRGKSRAEKLAHEMTANLAAERESLKNAKAQDEAVIQGIGDGLVTTDAAGHIVLVNKAFEEILGWKSQEVVGKKLFGVIPMLDDNGKKVEDKARSLNTVLNSKSPSVISTTDFYYGKKDGSTFPVSITAAPIISGGQLKGAVEIFHDNTHEREVDRAKTEFVSLASHQLKTPISTINWYAEMLLEGDSGKITRDQQKYVDEIYGGIRRMSDVINALLNVSRIDLGTFSVEPEPTNIVELSKSTIKDLEPKIFKRKIDFQEDYQPGLPIVKVDPKLMRMIIENLASNAIKYSPEKGRVKLSVKKSDEDILIKVTDSGYGIPKAQQDKIFSKMFRAENIKPKVSEGTGLGLYLVKSIVEYSNGKIWFKSEENKGSTFYVQLPISGMKKRKGLTLA